MNTQTDACPDAVAGPVERPVRPLPAPDMTLPSIAPDGPEGAHFYRASTVAHLLAAERERLRHALILRSQETYGVLMQEHAEAAAWIAEA